MTTTGKVVLGIGIALIVLTTMVVVAGYVAFNYIETSIHESVKADEQAGSEYGKATDQQGCIVEGLRRSRGHYLTDYQAGNAVKAFTDICVKNAKPTASFCEGVPSYGISEGRKWANNECGKAGYDESATTCVFVFLSKHGFCNKQ